MSSIGGVKWRLEHMDAPSEAQHAEWMRAKLEAGWTLGPVKDNVALKHPALVPYAELSLDVRKKDALFVAIVRALA